MTTERVALLTANLEALYRKHSAELLFHGWHHITFVAKKARQFAEGYDVNAEIVEAAALTHDLNYIVEPYSEPEVGEELRREYLQKSQFTASEIAAIEATIMEGHMAARHENISLEAKILSDADTIFKSLPVTPIILTGHYITENQVDLQKLARKIVNEQKPMMEAGIYFYTDAAKAKYLPWAESNLKLWENVVAALDDEDVNEMLATARQLDVI